MNPVSIFADPKKLDKYIAHARSATTFSGGASNIKANGLNLKPFKIESSMTGIAILPLFLHVPFDLVTGEPLPAPGIPIMGTIRTAIGLLKYFAKESEVTAKALKEAIGEEAFSRLDLNSTETTDEEYQIFKPWRGQLIYATPVMAIRGTGDKFAKARHFAFEFDAETGEVIDDANTPLAYKFYSFETACISATAKQMRDDNDALGDARRPQKDIDEQIKNLWKERIFSNPYYLGVSRYLFFPTNKNYELTGEIVKNWSGNKCAAALHPFEYYFKNNASVKATLDDIIGTRYDRYEDYIGVKIQVPEFTDSASKMQAALKISRTAAGSDEDICQQLEGFREVYADFRNDPKRWDEKDMRKCVYEFHTITDDAIVKIMQTAMPVLKAAASTDAVFNKYSDIIAKIDSGVSEELLATAMTDGLKPIGSLEIKDERKVDENTIGFGGDSLDAQETDILGDKDALAEAMAISK